MLSAADVTLLETLLGFFDRLAAENSRNLGLTAAESRRRVGDIQRQLGRLEDAARSYQQALEVCRGAELSGDTALVESGDTALESGDTALESASTAQVSQALVEEAVYVNGQPRARNYDLYPILSAQRMARVHVRIIESGAKMGGIGEPPLPAVAPAVANAVARLTGQRIRSIPLSRYTFT